MRFIEEQKTHGTGGPTMSNDYISRELVAVGLALKVTRRDFDAIDLQDA